MRWGEINIIFLYFEIKKNLKVCFENHLRSRAKPELSKRYVSITFRSLKTQKCIVQGI